MAFGFNFSNQDSSSSSYGYGRSNTFVDQSQQPFLDFTRNLAQSTLSGQIGAQQSLFGLSDSLLQQGGQFLGGLQNAGAQLSGFGNPAIAQAQIGQLGSDLGAFFQNEINPAIRRDAVASGGLGGGRQQVAQSVAAGELGRAFAGGVTDILANSEQQRLQAAQAQAGIQTQANLGGLNQLQGLFGLGASPFQQQLNPLLALSQIIGSPTVLSDQFNFNRSQSQSRSRSGGFDLGALF